MLESIPVGVADAARWVAMVLGFMSMGMALRIGFYYLPHIGRVRTGNGVLLPLHVVLISVSWATLCGSFMVELAARLGEEATWRSPVALVTGSLACYALVVLSLHLSKHEAIWEEDPGRRNREEAA